MGQVDVITRRDILKKGAIAGGVLVWAVPVVETLDMTAAYAGTKSKPGGNAQFQNFSYIAFDLLCGTSCYRMKLNSVGTSDADCGTDFSAGSCGFKTVLQSCGAGQPGPGTGCGPVSVVQNADNSVTVSYGPGCSITDWVVHQGQCCASKSTPNGYSVVQKTGSTCFPPPDNMTCVPLTGAHCCSAGTGC